MPDEIEQQNPEGLDLQHWLGVVRRRHFHFLIPLFIGWAAVWGTSWVLPPRYVSSTLILVEQPTMPKDYVTPNVNEDLQERLQSITQQILSRTRLLHIIDQFGLYNSEHASRSPDEKVELMRKDIVIDLVRDVHNQMITSFNVSYTSDDPRIAQQVTSGITNLFINENLEVRQQESEGTTQFLESQMESARKSLAEQEDRVRQFKAQHTGELPGQTASNIQILAGLQSQLQNDEDALNAAKQQHVYLQTLADQYRTMHETSKSADGTVVGLPALDQEINKLEAQLADLRSHYTERHPDVRKVKAELAEAEKTRNELLAKMKSQPEQSDAENPQPSAGISADLTQASVLPQIQSQLRSNQLEITNREHSIATLKGKIEDYQARLNEEPIREQQLADLTRGYEQSKAIYDELLKKKNDSAMATSMELLQQGERFQIMDAPSFPTKPDFPNRLKFCGMGLGIGLALGVIIAGTFEMLDHRIYDEKQLKALLPIPILSEIPEVVGRDDERRERRLLWLGWATGAFVVCCILAGTAFSYLRG